jgi:hypothetical protein
MRVPIVCLALALFWRVAAAPATCYADTILAFSVNATLVTGSLTGTISIDETTPEDSSFDITALGTTSTGPYTAFNYYEQGFGSDPDTFLFVVAESEPAISSVWPPLRLLIIFAVPRNSRRI